MSYKINPDVPTGGLIRLPSRDARVRVFEPAEGERPVSARPAARDSDPEYVIGNLRLIATAEPDHPGPYYDGWHAALDAVAQKVSEPQ